MCVFVAIVLGFSFFNSASFLDVAFLVDLQIYEGFYNFSKVCCPTDFALNISTYTLVSTVIITSIQL